MHYETFNCIVTLAWYGPTLEHHAVIFVRCSFIVAVYSLYCQSDRLAVTLGNFVNFRSLLQSTTDILETLHCNYITNPLSTRMQR